MEERPPMQPKVQHTDPAIARVNGIEICYETFGDPQSPSLLLVDGGGCQMIEWDEDFCAQLAARGYWVIRYDQRDMGLSTKFTAAGVPPAEDAPDSEKAAYRVPYTYADLADDGIALIQALGRPWTHVLGISLGGMIAQLMAIRHPAQVRTLMPMMTTTRNPDLPRHVPRIPAEMRARTDTREAYIETYIRWEQAIAGRYPRTAEYLRAHAERQWDRGIHPDSNARQRAAGAATPSWREDLRAVRISTLVIHGDLDPLAPIEGGIDLAAIIPGARLFVIEGWGHGYPAAELWSTLIDAICSIAK